MPSTPRPLGILTTDERLIVRTWDPWIARATGLEPAAALGRALPDLLPELGPRGLLPLLQQVMTRGTVQVLSPALHHYLFACQPSEPSPFFDRMQQHVTIGPLREEGRIVGIVVTVEDVTARMTLERQLAEELRDRRAAELKPAQLSEMLSHGDWRTRRTTLTALVQHGHEIVETLVHALRDQYHNLNVLSSALDLLTVSEIDVVEPLAAMLDHESVDLRIHAALMLGERRDPRAIPALIAHLSDPDPNVQFHIIEALGQLHATEAADALTAIAERRDFFLSFPAIQALSRVGTPASAPRLVPLLADPMLRAPVIDALGELGDEDVAAPLVELLNTSDAPPEVIATALAGLAERYEHRYGAGDHIGAIVRRQMTAAGTQRLLDAVQRVSADRLPGLATVLGWLEGEAVQRALTRLLGQQAVRGQVVEALVRYGGGVVTLLSEQLRAADLETRQAAAVALGRIGDRRATPALAEALDDPELAVTAAGALAHIGDAAAFDALITRLGDRDSAVRTAVVGALNSIGHPEMADHILQRLRHADPLVRESAVKIAGYYGYAACLPLVIDRCDDDVESVRRVAVEQLPFFDDPAVFDTLAAKFDSDSAAVRAAATTALARVMHPQRTAVLHRALADDDPWVRYFALRALGSIDDNGSISLVLERLQDPAPFVQLAAIEVIGRMRPADGVAILEPLTASGNADIASAAIMALAHVEDPAVRPVLERALASKEPRCALAALTALATRREPGTSATLQWVAATEQRPVVAQAAIDALATIAVRDQEEGANAIRTLIALSAEPARREAAITALSGLPARHVMDIVAGLRHPAVAVRRACVEALGRMRHPDATSAVESALDDAAPEVRLTAVAELKHLGARTAQRKLLTLARRDPDGAIREAAMRAVARTGDVPALRSTDAR